MTGQPGRPRLRLQDVADEVGVSAKTVSNAYRAPDQLTPALRQRILDTAERLGYPGPNPMASGLRTGRAGAIGVVYANRLSYAFDDPNTNALLAGFSSAAEAAGVGLLLLPGSADAGRRAQVVNAAMVDGIIASSLSEDDPLLRTVIDRRIPLVVIDQPRAAHLATLGAADAPWVGIDDFAAARVLADYLLELGHTRFGVVSFALRLGPTSGFASIRDQETATLAVTRDRLAGYRTAVAGRGIDWTRVPVSPGEDSTAAIGYAGARAVLATSPAPTALLCLSDRLAEGALGAARDLGLAVPGDLSVVGFDNAPNLAAGLGLTTIDQPSRAKGEHAARALINLVSGGAVERHVLLPTELVVRTSTGPPGR